MYVYVVPWVLDVTHKSKSLNTCSYLIHKYMLVIEVEVIDFHYVYNMYQ